MEQVNFEIKYRENITGWKIYPPKRPKFNHLPRYIYYHKNRKLLRIEKYNKNLKYRRFGQFKTLDEALERRKYLIEHNWI